MQITAIESPLSRACSLAGRKARGTTRHGCRPAALGDGRERSGPGADAPRGPERKYGVSALRATASIAFASLRSFRARFVPRLRELLKERRAYTDTVEKRKKAVGMIRWVFHD